MPFLIATMIYLILAGFAFGVTYLVQFVLGSKTPYLGRAAFGSAVGFFVGCVAAFLFGINWSGAATKMGATMITVPISIGFAGFGAMIAWIWGRFEWSPINDHSND